MALSGAQTTQHGVSGYSQILYGDFSGKVVGPTITGPFLIGTPENQLNIETFIVANRSGELPTLSGADSPLMSISLISGDNFQLSWQSNPDFDVLGPGPFFVQIDIDDLINPVVTHPLNISLSEASGFYSKISIRIGIGL